MRAMRFKQLLGEIVELRDSFRIYGEDGLYYITRDKEKAFQIAHDLLKGNQPTLK